MVKAKKAVKKVVAKKAVKSRNPKIDAIVKHVSTSKKYLVKNAAKTINKAMKKAVLPPIIPTSSADDSTFVAGDVLDECDQADVHQHNFINGAVANIVAQLPDPTQQSLKECEECGDKIPKGRREALPGVKLCVGCQEDVDNANRRKQVLQGYVFKNAVIFNQ
jgi:phage/conjugal plasmid C-4 type zinc finger TraR family protein